MQQDEQTGGSRASVDDYQAVSDFIDKMEKLSHFQDRVDIRSDIGYIWQAIREDLAHLVTVEVCALFLVNAESRAFELYNAVPLQQEERCRKELDYQIQCGMFSWVINRRSPALVPSLVFKEGKSMILLPLSTAKRTIGAVLVLTAIQENAITQEDMRLLTLLTRQSSLTLENAILYDRLKREHEDLLLARNQIQQAEKFASIGRITSGAFHEILNPLNIISGHIQFALMGEGLDTRLKRYLTIMQEQSDRIARIVKGLLQFSHFPKKQLETFCINEMIDRVLLAMEHDFAFERIRIEKRYTDDLPQVTGSVENLSKALSNLLTNAKEAMSGGGTLEIETGLQETKGEDGTGRRSIQVVISDTGGGIPPENADKVFEPFFTTSNSRSGLGLPTAYSILHDHGGELFFRPRPEGGTVFTFSLPLA